MAVTEEIPPDIDGLAVVPDARTHGQREVSALGVLLLLLVQVIAQGGSI